MRWNHLYEGLLELLRVEIRSPFFYSLTLVILGLLRERKLALSDFTGRLLLAEGIVYSHCFPSFISIGCSHTHPVN